MNIFKDIRSIVRPLPGYRWATAQEQDEGSLPIVRCAKSRFVMPEDVIAELCIGSRAIPLRAHELDAY